MIPRSRAGIVIAAAALVLSAVAACASFGTVFSRPREVWGFAAPWDPKSDASIRAHANELDAVVTGWIALDSNSARPLELFVDTIALPQTTRRFALVTSWHTDRFHPAAINALADNGVLLAQTAGTIAMRARRGGYAGLVLDFEGHAARDLTGLMLVSRAIADSARAHGVREMAMAIPATDTAAYPAAALLRVVDRLVVMLYDEHWARSGPGPIASPQWVRTAMALRLAEVGPSKLIAGLPLYGYRWGSDSTGVTVGWEDVQRDATRSGVQLSREPATYTLRARAQGWETWIADAALLDTLIADMERIGVRRIALWRLGTEDPAVWKVLEKK